MNLGQRSPDLDKRGKTETSGNIHHWKHPSDSRCCVQERPGSQNLQNLDHDAQEEPGGDTSGVLLCSPSLLDISCDSGIPCSPSSASIQLHLL